MFGAAAFGFGLVATVKRLERESATLAEKTSSRKKVENADLNAAISVETSKTEALRGEFEETLARAAAFAAAKSEKTAKSGVAANGDANETERLQ